MQRICCVVTFFTATNSFAQAQIVDNSPDPGLTPSLHFEPKLCAPGTPGLSLALSLGIHHNSRAFVVNITPNTAIFDARFFVITLAGIGFSFSANRDVTFISPPGISGSAYLNISSVIMIVTMASSWNFPRNEPITFAFGNLESVRRLHKLMKLNLYPI
jgi:hypothetical protein